MTTTGIAPLSPFRVRSFRFQWPADLATSWAFEMETLILGWYVLVQTDSVLLLTAFGSLQFAGTLIAPMFGVVADRVGRRTMLCSMRTIYAILSGSLMLLAFTDLLTPWAVFAIALISGLVRPSDLVMRNSLIGDTVPSDSLMSAMGLSRTTMDSARIAGALAGAGLFAALGFGPAYAAVTGFYLLSLLLTLGVARSGHQPAGGPDGLPGTGRRASPLHELREGLAFVWNTPEILALMLLAFLVNLTAYPISNGLLPFVAREIFAVDQNGLGHLVAAFAIGALIGSIGLWLTGGARRPGRFMLLGMLGWYALIALFGHLETKFSGFTVLLLIGLMQSFAMVSMSVVLVRIAPPQFRGRVMGVRMLAVYGLPVGLLLSGVLVEHFGYQVTVTAYALAGAVVVSLIGWRWRGVIWR